MKHDAYSIYGRSYSSFDTSGNIDIINGMTNSNLFEKTFKNLPKDPFKLFILTDSSISVDSYDVVVEARNYFEIFVKKFIKLKLEIKEESNFDKISCNLYNDNKLDKIFTINKFDNDTILFCDVVPDSKCYLRFDKYISQQKIISFDTLLYIPNLDTVEISIDL